MSMKTLDEVGPEILLHPSHGLDDLEYVLNFESFPLQKTGSNIAQWLIKSHTDVGLHPNYVMHHATDGASNAILSAKEFEALTRDVRESTMTFSTCSAHQIHWSALYAAGDPSFKP